VAIEPLIDVKKEESGEEFDYDPRSGDCFADFAQLPESSPQVNSLIRENANDVNGINEGVMASPEMLVARGRPLGGLRARVVGNSSNIQIRNIDGLPPGPNAARARAAYTNALGRHVFGVSPVMNGTSSERTGVKLRKNGKWTDEDLNAAMLAIDDGAPIKTVARLYGIPTTSLRHHVFGKTLSRKRGKSGVLSSEEENELVN
jgi:hypothetical protein